MFGFTRVPEFPVYYVVSLVPKVEERIVCLSRDVERIFFSLSFFKLNLFFFYAFFSKLN